MPRSMHEGQVLCRDEVRESLLLAAGVSTRRHLEVDLKRGGLMVRACLRLPLGKPGFSKKQAAMLYK